MLFRQTHLRKISTVSNILNWTVDVPGATSNNLTAKKVTMSLPKPYWVSKWLRLPCALPTSCNLCKFILIDQEWQ